MQTYQHEFLRFAQACGALRFGAFTLKSGRLSPYFFNTGQFDTGLRLARLGHYYAAAIAHSGLGFDHLYGPAYKGIPLVAAVAIALAERHGIDLPYSFNRKEAKTHGEGGVVVGAALRGRVLIVDDVISAGTSVRESVAIIHAAGAQAVGVAIAVDRQERGLGALSACQEVAQSGLQVIRIVGLGEVLEYAQQQPELAAHIPAILTYQITYGEQRG
jgi:orotate phosphoribosyltransferase